MTAASNSTTIVERSIRGIKLSRKDALFAGSDGGAQHWAVVACLVETCKLNDVDPLAYLSDVPTRIVNRHPNRDIDQLLPWAYRAQALKAVPNNDAYCAPPLDLSCARLGLRSGAAAPQHGVRPDNQSTPQRQSQDHGAFRDGLFSVLPRQQVPYSPSENSLF
ncbi:hypothetical protein ACVW16_001254 [Bradyrhizobium sp. USDA 4474]